MSKKVVEYDRILAALQFTLKQNYYLQIELPKTLNTPSFGLITCSFGINEGSKVLTLCTSSSMIKLTMIRSVVRKTESVLKVSA